MSYPLTINNISYINYTKTMTSDTSSRIFLDFGAIYISNENSVFEVTVASFNNLQHFGKCMVCKMSNGNISVTSIKVNAGIGFSNNGSILTVDFTGSAVITVFYSIICKLPGI